LSHGHWDHGDGLRFLENCTLITHPLAFIKRFRKKNNTNIGLALSKSELEQKFELITTEKPYAVTAEIIFLGEVPRGNNFESQTTTFVDESGNDDFIPDDSGIVVKLKNELVVISGCAHSGICNIIEHAIQITGTKKVKAVLGGFHLKHNNVQTQKTIEYLKQQKVEQVYPSHCTELPALSAFYAEFKIQQLKTGTLLNF
ncbi:MAG: MBL fold metallo-hydrolase, partial [Cyclobacteriaceae bacterium]|nr:MBL fold metallo-hydrolase [Cyclobacteriaceae bacterium]